MVSHCCQNSSFNLSDFSDLAQVVIAVVNLFLAGYIIVYQIRKDKKTDEATSKLNEQNIKLQWFKELIVQPNITHIDSFFNNLHTLKDKINSNDLSIEEKENINAFVKAEQVMLRKAFVDVLLLIDRNFGEKVLGNLDKLVDGITDTIFNDELKINLPAVYEKNIGSKISYSKNNLLALLYNYKGLSE